MSGQVEISPASPALAEEIALIHHESLAGDYLTSLGLDFLKRVYYPRVLRSKSAVTFAAFAGAKPVGFVTVSNRPEDLMKEVVRHEFPRLVRYELKADIANPIRFLWSIEVLVSMACGKSDPVRGEIVFIATDEKFRGQGAATSLVDRALDYLRKEGTSLCRTKTLGRNHNVIRLYEKMGWRVRNQLRFIGKDYVILVSPKLL